MPQIRQMGYGSGCHFISDSSDSSRHANIQCLLTRHDAGVGRALRCRPPKLSPTHCCCRCWIGRMFSGQSTNQTMCLLEGVAAPCRRLAVYPDLSNDHPWDYRQYVRSVCTGEQRTHEMCVPARHLRSISQYRVIDMNPSYRVLQYSTNSR